MGASIGITVGVNGEDSYKRSLSNIIQQTKAFKSELKEVQSAFTSDNNLGGQWEKASSILSKEIQSQKDYIEKLNVALDTAKSKYGEASTEVYRLEDRLNKAGEALHAMERQLVNGNIPAIERAASETKYWESELAKVQSSFTNRTSNWTQSSSTASVLSESISAQKREIALLEDQVRRVGEAYGINSKECNEWKIKLNEATAELNRMQNQLKELPNFIQAIGKDWENVGNKIQTAGSSISRVGDTLSKISVPVAAGFASTLKTGFEFEETMAELEAVTFATNKQLTELEKNQAMDALRNKARELARETVYTAEQVASAMVNLSRNGWGLEEILNGIDGVLNLAAADGMDLADAAEIVSNGINALGKNASDSAEFVDYLAQTSAASATNISLIGESFKYAAPLAGDLGYEINELALAIGLAADYGVKGSQSGTGLRQAFKNLISPTETVAAAMEKYGINLYDASGQAKPLAQFMDELRSTFGGLDVEIIDVNGDVKEGEQILQEYGESLPITQQEKLMAIVDLFGTRALPAMLAIIDASEDKYAELKETINAATDEFEVSGKKYQGAAEAIAATRLDQPKGDIELLKDAWGDLQISLSELMIPTFRELVEGLTKTVNWINSLDSETKEMIIKAGLVVAALGPVLSIGGRIVSGIGVLISGGGQLLQFIGSLSGVIPGIIGGIGSIAGAIGTGATGLVGAIGSVVAGIGSAITAALPVIGLVTVIGVAIAGLAYLVVTHWDSIKAAWTAGVEHVKNGLEDMKNFFANGIENLKNLAVEGFHAIVDTARSAFDAIADTVKNALTSITTAVKSAIKTIGDKFKEGFENVKQITHEAFDAIRDKIHSVMDNVREKVNEAIVNIGERFRTGFEEAKQKTHEAFESIKNKVSEAMENMRNRVHEATDSIKNKFDTTFGDLVNAAWDWGHNITANIASGLSSAWDWVVGAAHDIAGAVTGVFSGIASNAWNWGRDMVQNLVNGISGAIGSIKSGATSIAQAIRDRLHFSEPEVGPLSDLHTYMPDMLRELANGIYRNIGIVENASDALAATLLPDINSGTMSSRNNSTTITNGPLTVNVYGAEGQDVRELAKIIEDEITFNMIRRNVVTA